MCLCQNNNAVMPIVSKYLESLTPFLLVTPKNSKDPVEMLHNAAFHQDLHCLLRQTRSSENEIKNKKNRNYELDPSI